MSAQYTHADGEPIGLLDVIVRRDDTGRIIYVAGTAEDGRRLTFETTVSVGDGTVAVAAVFLADDAHVLSVAADIEHPNGEPQMTLRASGSDVEYYGSTFGIDDKTGVLSISGIANGTAFDAQVNPGDEIPEQVPDIDDTLPTEVQSTLAPLVPFVQMAAGSVQTAFRPRRRWWRRLGRAGCAALGGVVGVVCCVGGVGIGCIAGVVVGNVGALVCIEALHD
jgi:hypothetical protein